MITPAELYSKTKPAGGADVGPTINWATLSPSSGTVDTQVVLQISVSHPYGLSYIDGVAYYVTSSGYVNPNIIINDAGTGGDLKAGDGIYSATGTAGGDPSLGSMELTFVVTDKAGKSASANVVYKYINNGSYTEVSARQLRDKILGGSKTWAP